MNCLEHHQQIQGELEGLGLLVPKFGGPSEQFGGLSIQFES